MLNSYTTPGEDMNFSHGVQVCKMLVKMSKSLPKCNNLVFFFGKIQVYHKKYHHLFLCFNQLNFPSLVWRVYFWNLGQPAMTFVLRQVSNQCSGSFFLMAAASFSTMFFLGEQILRDPSSMQALWEMFFFFWI